jgi:hypothetical protein
MREYIAEKVKNTPRHFKFGRIEVVEKDSLPSSVDLESIFHSLENLFPDHFFKGLEGVVIGHRPEFDERTVNAVYRDGIFYITNQQDSPKDLGDDVVHEFAHHVEMLFPEEIYGDESIKKEFLKKRAQLEFEIRSEGYWTEEYDFRNLKFNEKFDDFLYKRIGRQMLKMMTSSIYIRPYASVSLREYFATGFEAYFLGKKDLLKQLSPILYNKIENLL